MKVLERVHVRGDERVMDAGCGSGRLTAKLLDRLPRGCVVGVDLSQNMLAQAAEHLKSYNGQVTLVNADLAHLPFTAEFDGIFSTAAFHWVKDHDALFTSLARSLKPGGWIVAQCGGHGNLVDVHRRTKHLMNSPKYAEYFRDFHDPWVFADAETTAARMARAGFTEISTWLEPAPIRFNSADEYKQFMAPVILRPFLNVLPDPKLKNDFVNELVDDAFRDPNFHLDYWRLNLSGRKA